MSFKTTAVLLLVALLVGGFYVLVDRGRPSTDDFEKTAKRVFRDWKSEEILAIAIARAATGTADVFAARAAKDAPWRLEKPLAVEADQQRIESILAAMAYADRVELVKDADAHATGLDAPRVRATFRTADGVERAIAFGNEDLSRKNVYAQVDGATMTVQKRAFDAVAKSAEDLRERALFSYDRGAVDRVLLQGPQARLAFRREGDHWLLEEPEQDFADRGKVDDLVTTLAGLSAKTFVEEAPATLTPFGLALPNAVATLEAHGVSQTALLGARVKDADGMEIPGEIYAKRGDRANVVTLEDSITEKIVWDADPWRSKQLLHLGPDRVEAIEVEPAASEKAPEVPRAMRLAHEGFGWRFTAPVTATADSRACEDLLRALEDVEVVKVARAKAADLANFGLVHPTRIAIATPKGRHVILLGRASGRENGFYAQREGREAVLEIVFAQANTLLDAYPALRERALTSFPAPEIVRFEVRAEGKKEARPFVRLADGGWSTPGAQADTAAADGVARALSMLTATRILGPHADLGAAGLGAPWLVLRATRRLASPAEGEKPQEALLLELGKTSGDGERYARLTREKETTLFTLAEEAVNALAKDPLATDAPAPKDAPAAVTGTAR